MAIDMVKQTKKKVTITFNPNKQVTSSIVYKKAVIGEKYANILCTQYRDQKSAGKRI